MEGNEKSKRPPTNAANLCISQIGNGLPQTLAGRRALICDVITCIVREVRRRGIGFFMNKASRKGMEARNNDGLGVQVGLRSSASLWDCRRGASGGKCKNRVSKRKIGARKLPWKGAKKACERSLDLVCVNIVVVIGILRLDLPQKGDRNAQTLSPQEHELIAVFLIPPPFLPFFLLSKLFL